MKSRHSSRFACAATALAPTTALITALATALSLPTRASAASGPDHHERVPVDEIVFQPGPPTLPEGVEFAVLHGNPGEPEPFVLRLKFPASYVIPPHMHPEAELVTVISGGVGVGTGTVQDASRAPILKAGGFVGIPADTAHFAWTEEETVVQINATGPFQITYVNDGDDPRIN